MYQTVGQDAIQFVAEALDVPLYRRVISGTAVDLGSEYGTRDAKSNNGLKGDETEDLFELLSTVKVRCWFGNVHIRNEHHPLRLHIQMYRVSLLGPSCPIINAFASSMCQSSRFASNITLSDA